MRWQWAYRRFIRHAVSVAAEHFSVGQRPRFEIAFGGSAERAEIDRSLAKFEAQQLAEIESLIRRFEARQDSNNVQLLQALGTDSTVDGRKS